jgi:hypothetical protein
MQSRRMVLGVVAAVVVVLVVVGGVLALRGGDDKTTKAASHSFVEPPSASPAPTPAPAVASSCPDTVAHAFTPTSITIPGVAHDIDVLALQRDANNVPGVPPLTTTGKHVFAYDLGQKVRPGASEGNVLLNAHTWPDGSALGNEMLSGLKRDGRIVVTGKKDQRLCYRVTKRVEVLATAHVPEYYSRTGTPRLAIIVCSGRRLGPEDWEKRTIWYATPAT